MNENTNGTTTTVYGKLTKCQCHTALLVIPLLHTLFIVISCQQGRGKQNSMDSETSVKETFRDLGASSMMIARNVLTRKRFSADLGSSS